MGEGLSGEDGTASLQARLSVVGKEAVTQRLFHRGHLLCRCQRELRVNSHHFCGLRPRLFIPSQLNIAGSQKKVNWDSVAAGQVLLQRWNCFFVPSQEEVRPALYDSVRTLVLGIEAVRLVHCHEGLRWSSRIAQRKG